MKQFPAWWIQTLLMAVLGSVATMVHSESPKKAWIPLAPYSVPTAPTLPSAPTPGGYATPSLRPSLPTPSSTQGLLKLLNAPSAGSESGETTETDPVGDLLRQQLQQSKGSVQGGPSTTHGNPIKTREAAKYFQIARNFWGGQNGHPMDRDIAIEMLRKSATAEYAPALYQLGKLYVSGTNMAQDDVAGAALIRRARQLGLTGSDVELKRAGFLF